MTFAIAPRRRVARLCTISCMHARLKSLVPRHSQCRLKPRGSEGPSSPWRNMAARMLPHTSCTNGRIAALAMPSIIRHGVSSSAAPSERASCATNAGDDCRPSFPQGHRQANGGAQLMSVAPMMDWTDVHFRTLARLISKRTWLWTEMVVDKTIIHTDRLDMHLWYPPEQHPIVLQMGGSDPDALREAARKAAAYQYDEINLNCGCPSDRVAGAGCFGAALMLQPELVADCMLALSEGSKGCPVTVKCRLGVDDVDDYASLRRFVATVSSRAPVSHFVVHSRKCLLHGLSPHQNRTVPPLRYGWVYALARDFPHLTFTLNGGVQSPEEVRAVLTHRQADCSPVAGVMLGRAVYNAPWQALARADTLVFGEARNGAQSRRQVLEDYAKYADSMLGRWYTKPDGHQSPNLRALARPVLNLFHGERNNKRWKTEVDRLLQQKPAPESLSDLLKSTLHIIDSDVLDAPPEAVTQASELFQAEQTGVWPPEEVPATCGLLTGPRVLAASR